MSVNAVQMLKRGPKVSVCMFHTVRVQSVSDPFFVVQYIVQSMYIMFIAFLTFTLNIDL